MELWPQGSLHHPKMEKRFFEGGALVWRAFMPRSASLSRGHPALDVKLPAMADPRRVWDEPILPLNPLLDLEIRGRVRCWDYGTGHENYLATDSPDNRRYTTRRLNRHTAFS